MSHSRKARFMAILIRIIQISNSLALRIKRLKKRFFWRQTVWAKEWSFSIDFSLDLIWLSPNREKPDDLQNCAGIISTVRLTSEIGLKAGLELELKLISLERECFRRFQKRRLIGSNFGTQRTLGGRSRLCGNKFRKSKFKKSDN